MIPVSCSVIKERNSLGKGEQRVKKLQKHEVRDQAIFNIYFMDEKLRHREIKRLAPSKGGMPAQGTRLI